MSLLPVLLVCFFAPAPFARPIHAYVGVEIAPGNSEMRLATVFAASPAFKAGLQMLDVIVAIDGKKVQGPGDLTALLRKKRPGNAMTVTYRRNNLEQTTRVTLTSRQTTAYIGISVINVGQPTVNVVAAGSPASAAGLHVNDVILTIDDNKFSNTAEIAGYLGKKKPGDTVSVAILRDNKRAQLRVTLGTRPGY
jgi:S1-C subfamily serine protease